MKKITIDGNEAAARASYLFTEMASIYPITPSSPMAEHIDKWSNEGELNIFNDKVKVVEMQSEAGAAGMMHGALTAGVLASTYTASQGLLLMVPNMYKMAGEMLPGVMHVAARSLATHALSILGDHQDVMATRTTGFCMIASSSVQDTNYLATVAHLSAIKSSLPIMHFFDGFRTSHELDKINILEKKDVEKLIDKKALKSFRDKSLNPNNPIIKGTAQNDDIYFQMAEAKNLDYENVITTISDYMEEINKITGSSYKPFNYYGSKKAKNIIVAMGSVCETIKETIDFLNKRGHQYGLVEVHLYRPFSNELLLKVIPKSVKKIAVLNRTKENGAKEPLYLDVLNALKNTKIKIVSGRYGLSSKNTNPSQIKAVFEMLDKNIKDNFTIGINDNVTNLSLDIKNFKISKSDEMLIYGYGSDGMVSASKSIITLVGDNTDKNVQGYFEYDSKKSGGVTISHLRFNKNNIKSTYYVENPSIVVVSKESYLDKFDCLENIKKGGKFILNTSMTKEEIINALPSKVINQIVNKKIKFYIIDAYLLAKEVGLGNKISTIMESAVMYLTKLVDYELAKEKMKEIAKKKFFKKGEDILNANYKAIDEATHYLEKINISSLKEQSVKELKIDIYSEIVRREGNKLPVSAFIKYKDGHFIPGTTKSKLVSPISEFTPIWNKDNCIMCNQCSFVCPHSVIRPYLLNKEEYEASPDYIKERCLVPIEKHLKEYYFTIAVSLRNCTGCGLCVNICPGKKGNKALELIKIYDDQKVFDYLEENISPKNLLDKNTVKGSQFIKPKFNFCGACAGCGETAYIKILTQLFGNNLVIANATGCSSIYGASMPDMPYSLPWANSLFEDNAEFGYGILLANEVMKNRIKNIMKNNMDNSNKNLFKKWLENPDDYQNTKDVLDKLNTNTIPIELKPLMDYIVSKSIWIIGGDGWAYDIGFGGIDHVLSSNDNVNILVLDSQVYSNTGGQSSKASPKGAVASFASAGKKQTKKDLAKIAMAYPNAYVAQISLGANMMQVIKAFTEAANHKGPSIIIAYTPCISHGIKGGMGNSVSMEAMATKCGYFPIFRYNPDTKKFTLDSKNPNFDLYDQFLMNQSRYSILKKINPEEVNNLLKENKENALERFEYYKSLQKED